MLISNNNFFLSIALIYFSLQETGIRNSIPFIKHSIKSIASNYDIVKDCLSVADLGCSTGTNTLMVMSNIIDIVHEVCEENNRKVPQLQVCLNDLFGNDFNTIFKLLPDFYAKLKKEKGERFGPCFVSAVPGSFYDRLFPNQSLHLVNSANCNHWLSMVCILHNIYVVLICDMIIIFFLLKIYLMRTFYHLIGASRPWK